MDEKSRRSRSQAEQGEAGFRWSEEVHQKFRTLLAFIPQNGMTQSLLCIHPCLITNEALSSFLQRKFTSNNFNPAPFNISPYDMQRLQHPTCNLQHPDRDSSATTFLSTSHTLSFVITVLPRVPGDDSSLNLKSGCAVTSAITLIAPIDLKSAIRPKHHVRYPIMRRFPTSTNCMILDMRTSACSILEQRRHDGLEGILGSQSVKRTS